MKDRSFCLQQFRSNGSEPKIRIIGNIARHSNILLLGYALIGPLADVIIPAPADVPMRKNALWEETCFEFFICADGSDNYWEFNLSPAGHWNIYRFTSYRAGMQQEQAFQSLPFSVRVLDGALRHSRDHAREKILPAGQALKVSVSAIINTVNDGLTYWALAHPGPQPDFHRKESFILEL